MHIQDIKRGPFTFTDGVGYISRELADEVALQFGFTSVSAVQIRLAGAKGVLMLKKSLKGKKV